MVAIPGGGIHFTNPGEFTPFNATSTALEIELNGTASAFSTTVGFTSLTSVGIAETTDWTANTYKTLLSIASGKGFVAAVIGPESAGADTTTFEITVDGVLTELPIVGVASQRSCLASGGPVFDDTAAPFSGNEVINSYGALNAGKTVFGTPSANVQIPSWQSIAVFGAPLLKFSTSLLIRAKHSQNITNSTATAFSGVMYRSLLA